MLFPVKNVLQFYISTFQSKCAVPNVVVFCSSLVSCFPGMLLGYFTNDFQVVPVTPTISGVTFVSHSTYAVLIFKVFGF